MQEEHEQEHELDKGKEEREGEEWKRRTAHVILLIAILPMVVDESSPVSRTKPSRPSQWLGRPRRPGRRELACKQDDTPFSVPAQRKGAAHCRVCSGMTRILYITIIYIIIYIIYNSLAAQRKGAAHCRVCSDMTRIL